MLFLDLELYAPPHDRDATWSSLVINPAKPDHILLGGCLYAKRFADPIPASPLIEGLWLWNHASEADLLGAIRDRFVRAWSDQRSEGVRVLGKPAQDLVVCGAGITKVDLPTLYCRSLLHGIAKASELFEIFLKVRPIDLMNTGSFLFPEERTLYPKTTRELAGRLGVDEVKGPSQRVWDLYEARDHAAIEARTRTELGTVIELYRQIQRRIVGKGRG